MKSGRLHHPCYGGLRAAVRASTVLTVEPTADGQYGVYAWTGEDCLPLTAEPIDTDAVDTAQALARHDAGWRQVEARRWVRTGPVDRGTPRP